MLTVYGTIVLAFVAAVSSTQYLVPASALKGDTAQHSGLTTSQPAAAAPAPAATVEPSAGTIVQTASSATETLAENAWDFNRPETIPGFGPMTPTAPRHAQQEQKPATPSAEQPGVDIRAVLDDPALRAQASLNENAWDFNAPDSIPGFGTMPPADEPRRVASAPQFPDESRASSSEW